MKTPSNFDWNDSDALDDDETEPMEKPKIQPSFFQNDTARPPTGRVTIALTLDREIIKWFRAQGPNWDKRMSDALRAYIAANNAE